MDEAVFGEGFLVLVSKSGKDFWFVPIDGAIAGFMGAFGDTRDVFIPLGRKDVISVLCHTRAEGDPSLADIFPIWLAGAALFVYAFLVKDVRTRFVFAAE